MLRQTEFTRYNIGRKTLLTVKKQIHFWRRVLGGGLGVPCTVNPLYDGPKAEAEASVAA